MNQEGIHTVHSSLRICFVLTVLSLVVIVSCSRYPFKVRRALNKAGPNRQQLVKVINHFSKDPADSLKLQATYFLIGNMPGHHYHLHSDIFDAVFDSAATCRNMRKRKRFFNHAMKRIRREHPTAFYSVSTVYDLKHVTAKFLIQNINLAFKAYRRMPERLRPGFHDFCRYILPYRASNEPLDFGNRKKQFEKYQWVYEKLRSGQSLLTVVHSVIDSMGLRLFLRSNYPGLLTAGQVEKTHFGFCEYLVNYAVNALRAVGIPVSFDFTPHYGNHSRAGHSWLVIHRANQILAIDAATKNPLKTLYDVATKNPLNKLYKKSSLSKIYRYTYKRRTSLPHFWKDVTSAYKPPNRIAIARRWDKNLRGKPVYLAVFDRSSM